MGNCIFKGFPPVEFHQPAKVVTASGGIMELFPPITADSITTEFPGHGLYRSSDPTSLPLLHHDGLVGGQMYYLLPLNNRNFGSPAKLGHYRMSFENRRLLKRSAEEFSAAEVEPRYSGRGVWKVKLVIRAEELAEIVKAEDGRTEELIESVRTVAKCGKGIGVSSSSSSIGNSDQWSVCSSSWKESMANW